MEHLSTRQKVLWGVAVLVVFGLGLTYPYISSPTNRTGNVASVSSLNGIVTSGGVISDVSVRTAGGSQYPASHTYQYVGDSIKISIGIRNITDHSVTLKNFYVNFKIAPNFIGGEAVSGSPKKQRSLTLRPYSRVQYEFVFPVPNVPNSLKEGAYTVMSDIGSTNEIIGFSSQDIIIVPRTAPATYFKFLDFADGTTFWVKTYNPDVIQKLLEDLSRSISQRRWVVIARWNFGGNGGFNAPWHFYHDPRTIQVWDQAIYEGCWATPPEAEYHALNYGQYSKLYLYGWCPTTARVIELK